MQDQNEQRLYQCRKMKFSAPILWQYFAEHFAAQTWSGKAGHAPMIFGGQSPQLIDQKDNPGLQKPQEIPL